MDTTIKIEKIPEETDGAEENFHAWLPFLLQTADPLFPTGAYAHSHGLEDVVRLGLVRDESSLRDFLLDHIAPAQTHCELPHLRAAHTLATADDLPALAALDHAFGARKPAREARSASAQIGRRRLQSLLALNPDPRLAAYSRLVREGEAPGHQVIVAALQSVAEGAPLPAALAAHYYLAGSGPASAALKLLRLGQDAIQRVLRTYLAGASDALKQSATVEISLAGYFDPVLDLAAMRHEFASERLFIS